MLFINCISQSGAELGGLLLHKPYICTRKLSIPLITKLIDSSMTNLEPQTSNIGSASLQRLLYISNKIISNSKGKIRSNEKTENREI